MSTQLYSFDGVENVKGLGCEYSFQGHTESNVFSYLAGHWVDINSSVVHLVLRQCLHPPLLLSLRFCRRSQPELSVADRSASI